MWGGGELLTETAFCFRSIFLVEVVDVIAAKSDFLSASSDGGGRMALFSALSVDTSSAQTPNRLRPQEYDFKRTFPYFVYGLPKHAITPVSESLAVCSKYNALTAIIPPVLDNDARASFQSFPSTRSI